jgi:cytochrome c-type biogenesis protein CcmF
MMLAHLGVAVAMVGMTGSSLWQSERITVMAPGQTEEVGGYSFTFQGAEDVRGPNYTAVEGTFQVTTPDGAPIATLHPQSRTYVVSGRETTEASIRTRPLGDLFAVIGEAQEAEGAYTVRLYFKPVVSWIWIGVGLMGLGGLVSLTDRRLRVGAPTRARRRGAAPQPALGAADAER